MSKPKNIRIGYNISDNDLNTKKNQIDKLIEKGKTIKIVCQIRGRAKYIYTEPLEKLKTMFSEYKIINAWGKNNNYFLYFETKK